MKHTTLTRSTLRSASFALCAVVVLAGTPMSRSKAGEEAWLTREEFRAPDGSTVRLYEDRYSDVASIATRAQRLVESEASDSDYLDLGARTRTPVMRTPQR